MAKNRMVDLRDHLFEVIEALKDKEEPMDLERARCVAEVAREIVGCAKVEVQAAMVAVRGGAVLDGPSEFFQPRLSAGDGR